MIVTFRRLLKLERARLLVLSAAMVAWFGLIMAVTRTATAEVQAKAEIFGDSPLTRGFGLGSLASPDAILAQMTGVSFNHPILLALVGAVSVTHGARACQGELLAGTLELTLSRSISRTAYLLGYVAFMVIAMTLLMSIAFVTIIGFERGLDIGGTLPASSVALLCLVAGVVYFAFGAIGMLVSVLLGHRGSATFTTVGVLVAMFAVTFAERGWPNDAVTQAIAPVSVFHWLDPSTILLSGEVDATSLIVPMVVSLLCIAAAVVRFERRDL